MGDLVGRVIARHGSREGVGLSTDLQLAAPKKTERGPPEKIPSLALKPSHKTVQSA